MTLDISQPPVRPVPKTYLSAAFLWVDWVCQWIAYWAGSLAIFRVLEYAGKLTIVVAIVAWIVEIPQRQEAAIRAAWLVVDSKGGGRIEALQYLIRHHVDLRGLYGSGGYFGGMALAKQNLSWSDLSRANFDAADLSEATLDGAYLLGTRFNNANLAGAKFRQAVLSPMNPTTQFQDANIAGADFTGITFPGAGEDYLYLSFASAKGWEAATFDPDVRSNIQKFAPCLGKDLLTCNPP